KAVADELDQRVLIFVVFSHGSTTMHDARPASTGEAVMWTCPKCKIDVEPEFEVCWSCGTARDGTEDPSFNPEAEGIIDEEAYDAEVEARRQESLVTVAFFLMASEAHAMRSRLEAEGIRVFVGEEQTSDWLLPTAF